MKEKLLQPLLQELGEKIVYKEEMDSTNLEAKRLAEAGAPDGTLVLTECQTQGRGRMGRSWSSPKGTGIWMSLLLRPKIRPERASGITLVAALAVSRAIERVTGLTVGIKWPNDLVIKGKKLCGILTEMSSEPGTVHYIILGIGINVNTKSFPEELSHATSLKLEGEKEYLRTELLVQVLEEFSACYADFLKKESMELLLADYNARLVNEGCQVQVIKDREVLQGIAHGINAEGELLVETPEGLQKILSGEVSVRGVYGYV